jgi:hypothetical protein
MRSSHDAAALALARSLSELRPNINNKNIKVLMVFEGPELFEAQGFNVLISLKKH